MHREFTVTGIAESALAEKTSRLRRLASRWFQARISSQAGEIVLRLDGAPGAPAEVFDAAADRLEAAAGGNIFEARASCRRQS